MSRSSQARAFPQDENSGERMNGSSRVGASSCRPAGSGTAKTELVTLDPAGTTVNYSVAGIDPGTYDVYIAFDLLNREGGWVHRTTAYLTDVTIEQARRTRLDGLINLAAGSDREVELESSTIEPDAAASPEAPGP